MEESAGGVRTIVIMRHARAETFATEDRLRELTERGRLEAAEAGRWLQEQDLQPDAALVSSSLRTRQTWEALSKEAGCGQVGAAFEDALYSAGTDTVLECLRTLPEETRTVAFIGHNPTAGMLVQVLADSGGDEELLRRLGSGFPPGAVAVLTFSGSWTDLGFGSARLVDVRVVHGS